MQYQKHNQPNYKKKKSVKDFTFHKGWSINTINLIKESAQYFVIQDTWIKITKKWDLLSYCKI